MGWVTEHYPREKKEVVASLTSRALKVRVVGNHVWSLCRADKAEEPHNFIMLHLLEKHDGCWSWKDIDESMGPNYWDCPLTLLRESPLNTKGAQDWAKDVREWHAERAVLRKAKVEVGKSYTTKSGKAIKILGPCGRSSWVARYSDDGKRYKVTKNQIAW